MELSLIIALFILYIASVCFMKKEKVKVLWLFIFILVIVVLFCMITFMQFGKENLMATVGEMWQLYVVYFAVETLLVVALINLWMFKSAIWKALRGK